jgi:hypothetical protein
MPAARRHDVAVRDGTNRDSQGGTLRVDDGVRWGFVRDPHIETAGGDLAVDDDVVADDDVAVEDDVAEAPLTCATCGTPLDGDPDEHAAGDAGLPTCGECERANHFVVLDMLDGELDDTLP